MSNVVTNILTINGTDNQVAKVREFIKGSNGESISFQSIYPVPKNMKGKRMVKVKRQYLLKGMKPFTIPDWLNWRLTYWGCKWDAIPIQDEAVDNPNRIIFNTPDTSPLQAIIILSMLFPEVTLNIIFSDECPQEYCGEYTFREGEVTSVRLYDRLCHRGDLSVDQQMEYYFRTHEYAREEWRKDEDGKWINIAEEEVA